MAKSAVFWLVVLVLITLLVTSLAPVEQTLGENARLVYLHGAWVWVAIIAFFAAAVVGLAGLLSRSEKLHLWSRAVGRAALTFWVLFFPMSLYVMQENWNGLYFDEPRWRIPFTFAVTGVLLQLGLSLQKPAWASVANIAFAIALGAGLSGMENILHPLSPVFSSDSWDIRIFFGLLLFLLSISVYLVAKIWFRSDRV